MEVGSSNDPPVIEPIEDQEMNEDGSLELQVVATDVDEGDSLDYFANSDTSAVDVEIGLTTGLLMIQADTDDYPNWTGEATIQVTVIDDNGGSAETGFILTVVEQPDAPAAFSLISPEDGVVLETLSPTLTWHSTTDVDPEDELSYSLIWVLDDPEYTPENVDTVAGLTDTTYTFEADVILNALAGGANIEKGQSAGELDELLPDHTAVYWYVLAQDTNTEGTRSTQNPFDETGWSFTTYINDPPTPFGLLTPEEGAEVLHSALDNVAFTWEASTDPDPDEEVGYELHLTTRIGGGEEESFTFDGIEVEELTVALASEMGIDAWSDTVFVNWHVMAVSGDNAVSSSDTLSFYSPPGDLSVEDEFQGLPQAFALQAVYPNPFNPATTVVLALPRPANLEARVYNVLGQQVARLASGRYAAGYHKFTFDAGNLSSGLYFVHATVPGELNALRKVLLVR